MYTPVNKEKYQKKAKEVMRDFVASGGNFEQTAMLHWFRNIGSVYRYLKYAGYKFPERQRNELGRFINLKGKHE